MPVQSSGPSRRALAALSALIAPLALSCSDGTAPVPAGLVGLWNEESASAGATAQQERWLTLRSDGWFASQLSTFGLYEGQQPFEMSAFWRVEGTFRAVGDRLIFTPRREITWDHADGADSPPHVEPSHPHAVLFPEARYVLSGHRLTLQYRVYAPDDADYTVTTEFARVMISPLD